MIIIGEKINCTRKEIVAACEARDSEKIDSIAKGQADAGADYIDVNSGIAGKDEEIMEWLLGVVLDTVDKPIAIDTSHPAALVKGFEMVKQKPLINSVSAEKERYEQFLPIIDGKDCAVVALLMSDKGTPTGVDDRVETTDFLVEKLTGAGVAVSDIFVDPCVLPASSAPGSGKDFILAIQKIKEKYPEIHITGGLSNVSYGLPNRKLLNRIFIAMCIAAGLDSAIANPMDREFMDAISAAEALIGLDEYCMNYLTAQR